MKLKYTATYTQYLNLDNYPDGATQNEILNIEEEYAYDTLVGALEVGEADVTVEWVKEEEEEKESEI